MSRGGPVESCLGVHAFKEIGIVLGLLDLGEQELHGVLRAHGR